MVGSWEAAPLADGPAEVWKKTRRFPYPSFIDSRETIQQWSKKKPCLAGLDSGETEQSGEPRHGTPISVFELVDGTNGDIRAHRPQRWKSCEMRLDRVQPVADARQLG